MLLCMSFLFLFFERACHEGQRGMHNHAKEKNFQNFSFLYVYIQAENLSNSELLPSSMKWLELEKRSPASGQNLETVKKDHFFPASQK